MLEVNRLRHPSPNPHSFLTAGLGSWPCSVWQLGKRSQGQGCTRVCRYVLRAAHHPQERPKRCRPRKAQPQRRTSKQTAWFLAKGTSPSRPGGQWAGVHGTGWKRPQRMPGQEAEPLGRRGSSFPEAATPARTLSAGCCGRLKPIMGRLACRRAVELHSRR